MKNFFNYEIVISQRQVSATAWPQPRVDLSRSSLILTEISTNHASRTHVWIAVCIVSRKVRIGKTNYTPVGVLATQCEMP